MTFAPPLAPPLPPRLAPRPPPRPRPGLPIPPRSPPRPLPPLKLPPPRPRPPLKSRPPLDGQWFSGKGVIVPSTATAGTAPGSASWTASIVHSILYCNSRGRICFGEKENLERFFKKIVDHLSAVVTLFRLKFGNYQL